MRNGTNYIYSSVADALETLYNIARRDGNETWILVIPLVHLLRGDSKPFEPVPPAIKPELDPWTGPKGFKARYRAIE